MYVERDISAKFGKIASAYSVVALVGARQAGKTTFLKHCAGSARFSYVLFDDPDARALFNEDVKKFEKQFVEGNEFAILDEVQYCKDAGSKIKYLADVGRRLWVTSSSESILGREVLSHLVGRVSVIRLYPFSLSEFLAASGAGQLTKQILERSVWEHMTYGGYPKVVTTPDVELKKTILRDLYETMLLKDVARTFSIDDVGSLEQFAKYLAVNTGSLLSYEDVGSEVKLSFKTLRKYLDAMEKSYLIARIPPFHSNKAKELTRRPKTYFVDTGLRNAVAKSFPLEVEGQTFENYVASELLKLGLPLKYWRTKSGSEVDFVVEKGNEIIPIEAKTRAKPPKIERGTRSFIDAYSPKTALVVSYEAEKAVARMGETKIVFTDPLEMKQLLSE